MNKTVLLMRLNELYCEIRDLDTKRYTKHAINQKILYFRDVLGEIITDIQEDNDYDI